MYFVQRVYLCGDRYCSNRRMRGERAHKLGVKDAKPNWESKAESEGLQPFYFWKEKTNYTFPTPTSPGNMNTFRNSGLLSVLFPLSHHDSRIQQWHILCYQSLHASSEWILPPNYIFSNTGMVNACICIPVKFHQVYFLKLSLEIPDCRCIYHIYFICNRSSKHFRFILFTVNFNIQVLDSQNF